MGRIAELFKAWTDAETAAALGTAKVADAKTARAALSDAAKALVRRLPFKTRVAVRGTTEGRYDRAEHIVVAEAVDVEATIAFGPGRLTRAEGEALCQRSLEVGDELVVVPRKAPSCARCLAIAEAVALDVAA